MPTTITVTTYQTFIALPTPSSIQYWIFGLMCLLIPTILLMSITAFRGRENDIIEPNSLVYMALIGLIIGSILGTALSVLNWGFIILFSVILGIFIWRTRT